MPKLSIVIPAYNAAEFVRLALDSIAQQSYKDYEVVVVNDGSIDNTQHILETYVQEHPDMDIRILQQDNQGYSGARNRGIEAARGTYVSLLDADDEYYPRSLEMRMKAFEKYDVDFVLGRCHKAFHPDERNSSVKTFDKRYPEIILEGEEELYLCDCREVRKIVAVRGFPMHPNTITFKKDLLTSLGMFNEEYAVNEDWELVYKTFFRIDRFVFVDRDLAVYKYYMQYVNKSDHIRVDIKTFYQTERRRYVRMVKLLNEENYDRATIRATKKRACSRKYKYKGLVAYRVGDNLKALKYYWKARRFDPQDIETRQLMLKALAPRFVQAIGKKIIEAKRRYEFKT